MNYYQPNLYGNYPYNQYGQGQSAMMPQPQPQVYSTLQGKIVDNLETARVTDISFGWYGVFPKADMSKVYVKTWTNNGTTNTITYKPIATEEQVDEEKNNLNVILNKIVEIENKIDSILSTNMKPAVAPAHPQQIVMRMLEQRAQQGNPVFKNLLNKVQQGDTQGVETIVRNMAKEKGIDLDTEFNSFRRKFGL